MAAFTSRTVPHHVGRKFPRPAFIVLPDSQRTHIRHDDVDPVQFGRHVDHPGPERRTIGNVDRGTKGGHAFALERCNSAVDIRLIARTNADIRALRRKGLGDRATDPLGAAGDENLGARKS
ncbi:hypothetical protein ACVL5V_005223 [Bradyrhizobium ottawaense]